MCVVRRDRNMHAGQFEPLNTDQVPSTQTYDNNKLVKPVAANLAEWVTVGQKKMMPDLIGRALPMKQS